MMTNFASSPYPLSNTTEGDIQKFCQTLWGWGPCQRCQGNQPCDDDCCPWSRYRIFDSYFRFYKQMISSYVPEFRLGNQPALRSHDDLVQLVHMLKTRANDPRLELMQEYFASRLGNDNPPLAADQQRAFNLAVKVTLMVTCSVDNQTTAQLELGLQPLPWQNEASLADFITRAFPRRELGRLSIEDDRGKFRDIRPLLTASRLKKIAKLRFRGTDDLRNHLRLDSRNGVVDIFHYTGVLKEHIIASRSASLSDDSSIWNAPLGQIAMEALHSLQFIMFPFGSDSELVLRELVKRENLDPDVLNYDFVYSKGYVHDGIAYSYFGARLLELYEELESPSPRGFLENWLERKSGARYVMMATLIGVFIAIVLGILSLGVGIFQAWAAYMAWKSPVTPT